MTYSREYQGRLNRAEGLNFEEKISEACRFYWKEGWACIEKTPEPMTPIKPYNKSGQFIAYYTGQAQPDFKGVLQGGRCIIFDVKRTGSDRITQAAVTSKQAELFDKYEKMEALCYVLVSVKNEKFYRIPWDVWKNMKESFGHKYMAEKELEPYEVPHYRGIVLFLQGVEV